MALVPLLRTLAVGAADEPDRSDEPEVDGPDVERGLDLLRRLDRQQPRRDLSAADPDGGLTGQPADPHDGRAPVPRLTDRLLRRADSRRSPTVHLGQAGAAQPGV